MSGGVLDLAAYRQRLQDARQDATEDWGSQVVGVAEIEAGWLAQDLLEALRDCPGPDGPGRACQIAAALRLAGWRLA